MDTQKMERDLQIAKALKEELPGTWEWRTQNALSVMISAEPENPPLAKVGSYGWLNDVLAHGSRQMENANRIFGYYLLIWSL
jgi:hypothetical protein